MRVRIVFLACVVALASAVGAQSRNIDPVADVQVLTSNSVNLSDLRGELDRALGNGGIDVRSLLQHQGSDIDAFVTAHDLRFKSDGLAYTAIVAERPATSTIDAGVLVLLSLVPQEVSSALSDQGLPPAWLPLLIQFPRDGAGRWADVSFLGSDRSVTIDMANAAVVEPRPRIATNGDGCLDCLIDRVKDFGFCNGVGG
jgi:hypothetical protein